MLIELLTAKFSVEFRHGENQNTRKEVGLGEQRVVECITPMSLMLFFEVFKILAFPVLSSKL